MNSENWDIVRVSKFKPRSKSGTLLIKNKIVRDSIQLTVGIRITHTKNVQQCCYHH